MVTAQDTKDAAAAGAQKKPVQRPVSFSVDYIDSSIDPRKDIYNYSCGNWIRDNPVPPNKTAWHAYWELMEWNLSLLRGIAEGCAAGKSVAPGSGESRVGNFYTSAMDLNRINELKFSPIQDLLDAISKVGSLDDIKAVIPKLHLQGVDALFEWESWVDAKDSTIYSLYFWQGGLSLPDREYYLSDTFSEIRRQFTDHMKKMFILNGIDETKARECSDTVMVIETQVAKASRAATDLRDVEKNYNRVDVAELDSSHPNLGLKQYMSAIGVPETQLVVVGQPEFLAMLDAMLPQHGVEQWKVYLRWHVFHAYARLLHQEVRDENFDFFARKLRGQQEPEPEWKKALATIDGEIGEALGKLYVEKHFDEAVRSKAMQLVGDIVAAFRARLQHVPWMSEETRRSAVGKLDKMNLKFGFPKRFRDYSGLAITPDDYVGNVRRSEEFEARRLAARIGGKVDKDEWEMTPPTVNAYYEPTKNEIAIPAGIMQPPFFDAGMDDTVNYAGIGSIVGHELTHGFDDQGRKFDASGNMHPWWSEEDESAFKSLSEAVVQAYGSQEPLPGMFINGLLTLGENIADLGGVAIAYDALMERLEKNGEEQSEIDGFTIEQRFFVAYCQRRRESIREDALRERLVIDPHSPQKYRAIIPSMDLSTFDAAFPPKPGEPKRKRIGLW